MGKAGGINKYNSLGEEKGQESHLYILFKVFTELPQRLG